MRRKQKLAEMRTQREPHRYEISDYGFLREFMGRNLAVQMNPSFTVPGVQAGGLSAGEAIVGCDVVDATNSSLC